MYIIQNRKPPKGRIADNTEERQRLQEATEGEGSPTIPRGKAEAIQNKTLQRGRNRRQYREGIQSKGPQRVENCDNIGECIRRVA